MLCLSYRILYRFKESYRPIFVMVYVEFLTRVLKTANLKTFYTTNQCELNARGLLKLLKFADYKCKLYYTVMWYSVEVSLHHITSIKLLSTNYIITLFCNFLISLSFLQTHSILQFRVCNYISLIAA